MRSRHLAEELLREQDGGEQLGDALVAVAGHPHQPPLRAGLRLRLQRLRAAERTCQGITSQCGPECCMHVKQPPKHVS